MPSGKQHDRQALDILGFALPTFRARVIDDHAARARLNIHHRVYGHDAAALQLAEDVFGERGRCYFVLHFLQDAGIVPTSIYPKGQLL